ncbi:nucleolar protein 3-like [Arachis ipaensis]|uniref:nucleolar protein 3-like n=1 Tax=Arachis ipaensis TaxID=130454 RepID=UPI0007AFA719|nr:nucleolar protein 3-like [Arachis ipaensis]
MDMLTLIGCVMEGKEVYFPRLIRHSMWRAHIRGLLLFSTLVTSLAELADVPWEDDDATPPPPDDDDKEVTIPWSGWVHEKPSTRRCSRPRAAVEAVGPSSSTAAAVSLPPPPAPEPTYLLVQHLLHFMGQEEEHTEELTQQEAPLETQATTEVQRDIPEPQPVLEPQLVPPPVPQPEPEHEPQPGAIVDPHPELQ